MLDTTRDYYCGNFLISNDHVYSDYTCVTETSLYKCSVQKLIILGMGGNDAVVEVNVDVVVGGGVGCVVVVVARVEVDVAVVGSVVV